MKYLIYLLLFCGFAQAQDFEKIHSWSRLDSLQAVQLSKDIAKCQDKFPLTKFSRSITTYGFALNFFNENDKNLSVTVMFNKKGGYINDYGEKVSEYYEIESINATKLFLIFPFWEKYFKTGQSIEETANGKYENRELRGQYLDHSIDVRISRGWRIQFFSI